MRLWHQHYIYTSRATYIPNCLVQFQQYLWWEIKKKDNMHKYMSLSIYATFFLFLILSRVILYSATTSKMSVVFLARHFLILFLVISFFFLLTLDLITFSILACACSLIPSRISAMALVPGAALFLLHLCLSKPILCTLVSPWTGRKKKGEWGGPTNINGKKGRTLNPLWEQIHLSRTFRSCPSHPSSFSFSPMHRSLLQCMLCRRSKAWHVRYQL